MRFILLVFTLFPLLASAAGPHSGKIAKTRLDKNQPADGFETEIEAVIYASSTYLAASVADNREFVGGILQCPNGAYFYTVGRGRKNKAPVRFSVPQPNQCRLKALWHTHGKDGKNKTLFSAADTRTAIELNLPFYMTDPYGKVRVFTPGDKTINAARKNKNSLLGMQHGTAYGRIVHDG